MWIDRFEDFRDAIQKAEADAEIRNVAIIQKAASATWQAAAWWLERKRKGDWAQRTETTGDGGGAVEVLVRFADEEPK
jgi:hypothetical protein